MNVATRRTRTDMRLGRFLAVGQVYRDRDTGDLWRVWQVHRADCEVELVPDWPTGTRTRVCLSFADLRSSWVWIANTPRPEAPTV